MLTPLRRRLVDYPLLLTALAAGGYAVWSLRQSWAQTGNDALLWLLLVLAGLFSGIALCRSERWLPDAQPAPHPVACPGPPRRWIGHLLFTVAVVLTIWVMWTLWRTPHRWEGTVGLWLIALLLAVVGGSVLGCLGNPAPDERRGFASRRFTPSGGRPRLDQMPRWLEVMLFLVIAGLAIGLRVYRIDTIPAYIWGDETEGGLDALNIIERGDISPFATGWAQIPNGYSYYMAGLIKLMGANWAMLKTASLLPAILTVLAIYPLGRLLFGPVGGLCAMLFMAVSRWHLTMSRWGWIEVAPPLFQILATFLLIRGLRERRSVDFVLGGVITGLMMYTYLSCRLALVTLVVFSVYWIVLDPDGPRAGLRRHWSGITLFFLAWAIAFGPLAAMYINEPRLFTERISGLNIFGEVKEQASLRPLTYSVTRHLKAFHQLGDRNGRHNLPGEPQTDPVTGLLFVVGVGYSLLRLRDRRRGLLLLWLFFGMAGGIFSSTFEAPQAYRSLTAVPAIALLAGDVLARLGRGPAYLFPDLAHSDAYRRASVCVGGSLVVATLMASAAWESHVYFGRQAESVSVRSAFHPRPTVAAKEVISALKEGTAVYLAQPFHYLAIVRFLVYGALREQLGRNTLVDPPYRTIRPETELPIVNPGSDALFVLPASFSATREYFRAFYPHATMKLVSAGVSPSELYMTVHVPAEDFAAIEGLNARFTKSDGQIIERTVAAIDESWLGKDVIAAEWRGTLHVPESAKYTVTSDGNLTVSVDGQLWSGRRFLGSGLHTLHVTQTDCLAEGVARLQWARPEQPAGIIAPEHFFRVGPPALGLTAQYYANEKWEGTPVFTQNVPFLVLHWPPCEPMEAPFSIRFVGHLRITKPGRYWFEVRSDDGARLSLDGTVVGESLKPYQANTFRANVVLSAGDHPIQLDYFQMGGASGLNVYWQPPGQQAEAVPPGALIPEMP